VNGAEYRHYSASEYFNEQLSYLKPDLIVISMGTNEAYNTKFDPSTFYAQVDSLVSSLKKANPDADFLFTTPGDSYRKRKVKNPDVRIARNVIQDYCYKHSMAYWDLYYIMGGYGSILQWFKQGMTAKDKLHFSRKGYELQGELLYTAINHGYQLYQQSKR
jgi:lysophospholipase L1-like esterase